MSDAEPLPGGPTTSPGPANDGLEQLRKFEAAIEKRWQDSLGLRIGFFVVLLLALLAYLRWFMFTPLPGLPANPMTGRATQRIDWLQIVIVPEDYVLAWFGRPVQFAIVERLLPLGMSLTIWAVAGALGWLALRALRLCSTLTWLEQTVFALGVGMNVVSLYTLLVGLAGLLSYAWVYVVPGAFVLVAAALLVVRDRSHGGFPRAAVAAPDEADRADPVLARWLPWAAAPFVVVMVFGGLLPPIDFDVCEYHLQVPKEWYQAGKVSFLPHNIYGNMPLGAEMPTVSAMAVLGDWWLGALAGKSLISLWSLVGAAAVYATAARFFDRRAAAVAMVAYISTPWILFPSMNGLVEGALAAYFVLAGFAIALWRERALATDQLHWPLLLLGGFLAGSAVACKYPAVLFGVLPLVLVVFSVRKGRDLRPPALLIVGIALACGPWLAKNWVLAANPVYPLLYDVFGGKARNEQLNMQWTRAHRNFDRSISAVLTSLRLVLGESQWLSPLLVPLALLSALTKRWRLAALALAAYVVYFFVEWWLMTHRIERFLVPVLPALALMAGIGAVWTRLSPWQWMLRALLIVGLAANFITITCGLGADNRFFASYETLRRDPERTDSWHVWLDENVPPGKKVILVGDAQPFDLEVPSIYSTTFDVSPFELWVYGKTPEAVNKKFAEEGISHVYVRWDEIRRYQSPGNYGFSIAIAPSLFQDMIDAGILGEPIYRQDDVTRQVFPVKPWTPGAAVGPKLGEKTTAAPAEATTAAPAEAASPAAGPPPTTRTPPPPTSQSAPSTPAVPAPQAPAAPSSTPPAK